MKIRTLPSNWRPLKALLCVRRFLLLSLLWQCRVPLGMRSKFSYRFPVFARNSIQVPDHKTASNGEFTFEFLSAFYAPSKTIDKPEFAFLYAKHRNIRRSSHRKCPQFIMLDFMGGFQVERRTISCIDIPIFRNFDITLVMSFMPAFILPMCKSVEIESGTKPCRTAGRA
jgi:hypothetical protein